MPARIRRRPLRLALVGVPNSGKTALFNRLTGSRQKVANYAGVTVERKEGSFVGATSERRFDVTDLPGAYSLTPTTLDEAITRDQLLGRLAGEQPTEYVICVVDATNLRLNLRLVLDLKQLELPMVVALNMSDLAAKRGFRLDVERLALELGVPVVPTIAVRPGGEAELVAHLERLPEALPDRPARAEWRAPDANEIEATQRRVREILKAAGYVEPLRHRALERLDAIVMHPILGILILGALLFLVFQAVFSWAAVPMDLIDAGVAQTGAAIESWLPPGPLRSLLVDGIVAGVGSVLVFLPQILILFLFILVLEDSGYLPRAAYLLDRVMGSVGLSGRAFIPLLSSFACAIPGIMATRTIPNLRDRLATIMIAPLMTCSARLPVYALVIAAFVPSRESRHLQSAGSRAVRALYRRPRGRDGGRVPSEAHRVAHELSPVAARAARVPLAASQQPDDRSLGTHQDLPAARRHDHPRADDPAVVPEQLSGAAAGADRPRRSAQLRRHDRPRRSNTSSRRSASTGRSRSRWCPVSPHAKSPSALWAPSIRCRDGCDVAARSCR